MSTDEDVSRLEWEISFYRKWQAETQEMANRVQREITRLEGLLVEAKRKGLTGFLK